MENETTQQFEVGQRVKIVDPNSTIVESAVSKTIGQCGVVLDVEYVGRLTHYVKIDNITTPFWYAPQHLELLPDETPQPVAAEVIQYPPLRVMKNDHEPMQTWVQLLRSEPQAVASQPHLYLQGRYELVGHYDLTKLAFNNYIRISTQCSTEDYFLIFVITEGV